MSVVPALWIVLAFGAAPAIEQSYTWAEAERDAGIAQSVLRGIALAESGMRSQRQYVPWPYTLVVGGQAHRYPSREEAAVALRHFINSGQRSIDIGPMQINWRWHSHLAERPEQLLSSRYNLWAAVQVLRECRRLMGDDLPRILGCYHAGPKVGARGYRYAAKVLRIALRYEEGAGR